jgi:YD repeat-containing protein
MRHRVWLVGLPILLLVAAAIQAGQERYDYDALGRLVRFINPAGEGTEYVYDAVGNILAVRQVQVSPPRITSVSPTTVRRGATTSVLVTGTDLL